MKEQIKNLFQNDVKNTIKNLQESKGKKNEKNKNNNYKNNNNNIKGFKFKQMIQKIIIYQK